MTPQGNLFGKGESSKTQPKRPRAGGRALSRAAATGPAIPAGPLTPGLIARIVLPTPVDRPFDYAIPLALKDAAIRGVRAAVPFGRRQLTGYIVEIAESPARPGLKPILALPDGEPLVDEGMMQLTQWIGAYYACSWGEALDAVIPAVIRRGRALRTVSVLRLTNEPAEALKHADELEERGAKSPNSPLRKQAKVLRTVAQFPEEDFRPAVLAEQLGFSQSPIQTLLKAGELRIEKKPLTEAIEKVAALDLTPPTLTGEQMRAVEAILPSLERDEYKTFLLRGVTGSGKTEVYLRVLEKALELGKSAIVLVPEISLTPQTVARFSRRFAGRHGVAVLHSAMTDTDRRREWKRIAAGEARVVIGPRSAVFAPVKDLGVIVVDEEHEPGYKQDHTPRYHARDVAVMRAHRSNAVCILGSATPSLESAHNTDLKRYTLIEMERRVLDRRLPLVAVVDMADECRIQKSFATLSGALVQAARDTKEAGQQAIFFLNRRGYFTFFQCPSCREVLRCPNCDVPMHEHRTMRRAVCHYCLETMDPPALCPVCHNGVLEAKGLGTERLVDEIALRVPGARIFRMDSDTMKKREDYEETLDAFRDGEADILVGTQMVAKGLDFPNVTLVGVVSADLNLYLADFRAQERTFQLLTQVAGRAGRGEHPGRVIVQTFTPLHPCIDAARRQDYWGFYKYELEQRKAANYPPYTRLLCITVEAREEPKALELAKLMRATADAFSKKNTGAVKGVLGPAWAPIRKLRGRVRQQVIVKLAGHREVALLCAELRPHVKVTEKLRVTLDVDPYSLL